MATSLNGWTAIEHINDPALTLITIPGMKRQVRVATAAAPLFAAFLADWERLMPTRLKLDPGPVDGWNYRQSRVSTGLSNHSSGTAVDCRYDVLKADNNRHMTVQEQQILKGILSVYKTHDGHHVLANGYVWTPGKFCDEMHTELSQAWDTANGAKRNTTLKDVQEVIEALKIDAHGVRPI